MGKLRRTCAVAIITLALAGSAFAGIIDSPGVVSPPPPQPAPAQTTSTSTITTTILTILSLIR